MIVSKTENQNQFWGVTTAQVVFASCWEHQPLTLWSVADQLAAD
jgi:hypothetical protein